MRFSTGLLLGLGFGAWACSSKTVHEKVGESTDGNTSTTTAGQGGSATLATGAGGSAGEPSEGGSGGGGTSASGGSSSSTATGGTGGSAGPAGGSGGSEPSSGGSGGSTTSGGSGGQTASCVADETCLGAPGGWQGPIVLVTGTEQAPPKCPGLAPATSFEAFGELSVPSSSCDCSCQAVPADQQYCGDVEVGLGSAPCSSDPELVRAVVSQGDCTDFTGSMVPSGQFQFVDISPSEWSASAECTPQLDAEIPAVTWNNAYVACELPTTCENGGSCVPELSEGEQLCVFVDGDVECPAGFPDRLDTWEDTEDTRGCSECTCGEPSGECSGQVAFRDTDCAVFRDVLTTLNVDFCYSPLSELGSTTAMGAVAEFEPSGGSCTPGESTPQGSATAIGRRTVCCR